jgi:hypothetical protein
MDKIRDLVEQEHASHTAVGTKQIELEDKALYDMT